jgi:glutamate-ammonia-ligase adenylyltransferase
MKLPDLLMEDFDKKWSDLTQAWVDAKFGESLDLEALPGMKTVFALSDFVMKNCIRHPELIQEFIRTGDLTREFTLETYRQRIGRRLEFIESENDLVKWLRRIRRREMIRIAWRDLVNMSDLENTMYELTALAEVLIDEALSCLYHQHCGVHGIPCGASEEPQRLVVIGMGKLGGGELNFSSDVDLIFAFPETGKTRTDGKSEENETFFHRLCRSLVKVLGTKTSEGQVFRVDTRLRPYGDSGPLVMSFDAMETYYQMQGREWERYAWIKARVIAGDHTEGHRLFERLSPFIYRRYLDYGAFESLRDMKRRISLEVTRKGLRENIKLGAGGIREVEFFAQAFQLIRGGVVPDLRERSIRKVLEVLSRENYVPAQVCAELWESYRFLRASENRIQAFDDQQTHSLPHDQKGRLRLALSMGFSDWEDFLEQLELIMARVHHHFNSILEPVESEEKLDDQLEAVWNNLTGSDQSQTLLEKAGYEDADRVLNLLEAFRSGSETRALSKNARDRLNRLIPIVVHEIGQCRQPEIVLGRILDLIRAVERRTCYISLLLENPEALTHLIGLSMASPWIISFLSQHPVLLDELLDPRTLYLPPQRDELQHEIQQRMERVGKDDLEYQLETLCIFKQANSLRVAAADVSGALPLMRVSDHLSYIAETLLEKVLQLAWNYLVENHGEPERQLEGTSCERGFVAAGYGKLGGLELSYTSDLDLVFLHAGTGAQTKGGRRPMDSPQFYSRLGQRMVHMLTARTRAGFLYDADMRLRPSGASGPLVIHIEAFRRYQMEEAWTWEHQALVRSRPIAGDKHLAERFEAIRHEVLCKPRDPEILKKEVLGMRDKVRKEHLKTKGDAFDLKQANGGIVDIEFLVQYLVLKYAQKHPELTRWTDNVRLLEALYTSEVLSGETAYLLRKSYLTLRAAVHRLSLQKDTGIDVEMTFDKMRQNVVAVKDRIFESD